MATNNSKSVPTNYVASLLKISDYNDIAPTRAAMSAQARQSLGLSDLSEDLRFYITNEYSKIVNKAKNIAEKLIKIMKSDY